MGLKFEFLADRKDTVPLIAKWYYQEWGGIQSDDSFEKTTERIQKSLNRDQIPLHLLAIEEDEILGVVELKFHEMDIYPDKEHWIGGVYVPLSHRGKGVATSLVEHAVKLARKFGVKTLYLQTEKQDGGLYGRLGWKILERTTYKNVDVVVMTRHLGV